MYKNLTKRKSRHNNTFSLFQGPFCLAQYSFITIKTFSALRARFGHLSQNQIHIIVLCNDRNYPLPVLFILGLKCFM